jgi:ABC-type Fe3+ transport system permease subunit
VCCGSVSYYLRKQRAEFNVFLHGIFPILASVVLLAPLYFQFIPTPPSPIAEANYFALGWMGVGIILMVVLLRFRPRALRDAAAIFVQDEPAAEEASATP